MIARSWLIWLFVNVFVCAYVAAGYLASHPKVVDLKLERGVSVDVTLLRLAESRLKMELRFRGGRERSELGEYATAPQKETGALKFAAPGAAVQLSAVRPKSTPVTYEAMPASSVGSDAVTRNLTSDLSVERGVWHWPPRDRDLDLHSGVNAVKINVLSVDPALAGERVQLVVKPPLGFKASEDNVAWLHAWFFWPVIVPVQLVWTLFLLIRRRRLLRAARGT
ncbi:MAG: hypothetical protein OJF48_004976 [Afipia sp.]|nr:MAG: hypothetical protein OJF48_004976 [Afipia sp.]